MADLSRRHFIATAGAAAVATGMPFPAQPVAAQAVAQAPLPTWIVGTPGEWNHEVVRAATEELAIRFRAEECEMDQADDDFVSDGPCECEACTASAGYEATWVARWDSKQDGQITGGDWLEAGFETTCSRCSYETSADSCGRSVDGEAVCEDCLTLVDWDRIDPERAAELRAESAGQTQESRHAEP